MFEEASKLKLRFNFKGNLSSEDLWDLPVTSLDEIYKGLSKVKKTASSEDSLLSTSKEDTVTDLKINIVKHIFGIKIEEKKKREERTTRLARKRQLQSILANKQDEELQGKSAEELAKLINELEE